MSDNSAIEWTDATWNPVTGCAEVSPGCDHCYARTFAERWRGTPGHYFEHGFDVTLRPGKVDLPLRWRRPRRIFVNSMSDLFHTDVPDAYIARVFAVMAAASQHTFQVLTKRHGRMRSLLNSDRFTEQVTVELDLLTGGEFSDYAGPLRNVWLGVSVEDQQRATLRIPALIETPAWIRWLSCEPLLGPIDLHTADRDATCDGGIDWLVTGGESGPGARPVDPAWVRSLRDQCTDSGIPFFFKLLCTNAESNSPACTPARKRPHSAWVKGNASFSGFLESRSTIDPPPTGATSTHVLSVQNVLLRHVTPIRESAGDGETADSRGVSGLLTVDLDQLPQESSCRHGRTPCGCQDSELPPLSFVLVIVRRSSHVLRVLSPVREACASPFSSRLTFEYDQSKSLPRPPTRGLDASSSSSEFCHNVSNLSRYMTAFSTPATATRRYLGLEKVQERPQIVRRDGDVTAFHTNHLAGGELHRLGDLTLGKPVRLSDSAQRKPHPTTCNGRQVPGHASAAPSVQWGGRTPKAGGRDLDGRTWGDLPVLPRGIAGGMPC